MKKVLLKFYFELARVLLAMLLGAGAGFTALVSENVTFPFKVLLLTALVVLMAVLAFGLLFVFLFIHKNIK